MISHIEVPVVIGIIPCTTAIKLGAGAGKQLNGKAVGVTTVIRAAERLQIRILVGVAIDDRVVTAVRIVRVEFRSTANRERLGLLYLPVLIHTYLQACIVIETEDAALHDVVRALHLHTVVLGMLEHETVESPVVGHVVYIDATRLFELYFGSGIHICAVDNDLAHGIIWPGPHLTAQVWSGLKRGNLDAFGNHVGSLVNQDAVTGLHQLQRLVDGQQGSGLRTGIGVVTRRSHMNICGRCGQGTYYCQQQHACQSSYGKT